MSYHKLSIIFVLLVLIPATSTRAQEQIHVGFLWHMHQPIYYPYESVVQTAQLQRYSFPLLDVFNSRFGPYNPWPRDAIQAGLGLSHLGAQVSFSGSLIENLNDLESAGINGGMWNNWSGAYKQAVGWQTALANPRLDMTAFGYHHPLMPLLDDEDIRMQIQLHKLIFDRTWGNNNGSFEEYTRGMFPAETAFSTRMIPALVAEGIDWVLVDNIHFDRACEGYPHTNASNLYPPNKADQINPNPADNGGAWVQLNNLWAPSQVSAPFGYQPHKVQHVDPVTGAISQVVAVPAARYEGNEDGRGGYGAFLYDTVMDQYLQYNTDAAHPMFVVLHHDGDNFGGGSEGYYNGNFQNMVNWVSNDADYDVSTVQDYLQRFPVDTNDVIHVEDGSWAGADNGDPEFKKWLGDPGPDGWSPDRNSWAVLTAAKNRVFTADAAAPVGNLANVMDGVGSSTERAWQYLMAAEASDHWYWDGTEIWDSNVTRGSNQAVIHADVVLAGVSAEAVAPTVFLPQREPYNPGGFEWGQTPEPSDFEVWTFVYDVSGVSDVTLYWRVDVDGENPLASVQNETFAGGSEVGAWTATAMTAQSQPPRPAGILAPSYIATRYSAMITGQQDVLIDYYVEAMDGQGNVKRSPIQHVYVGQAQVAGGDAVTLVPELPIAGQSVTVQYDPAGRVLSNATNVYIHFGFNGWTGVPATDPVMTWNAVEEVWEYDVSLPTTATQLNVVFNDGAGTWDNNNGQDWNFAVDGGTPGPMWMMDGTLDATAELVASNAGLSLYAGLIGDELYVATDDAGEGNDHFILIAQTPGAMQNAPWAKGGQVAAWDVFLADENSNDYAGWFDAVGATAVATGANGGVLEGTINLAQQYGSVPSAIYIAVAAYGDADGGALMMQVPVSVNADSNVDANEYALFNLVVDAFGDCDQSGATDLNDVDCLVTALLSGGNPAADIDGDGSVDGRDVGALVAALIGG